MKMQPSDRRIPRVRLLWLPLGLLVSACAGVAAERSEEGRPSPVAAPAPAPAAPARDGPAGTARLEVLSSTPFTGGSYAAAGVTGANKPEGMEYRLRRSVPHDLPAVVPRTWRGLELFIADPVPEGWLAFYRGPLAGGPGPDNAEFRAALLTPDGAPVWELELNRFLSRPDHLEIQDVRYADGALYFNEACQSYSREAGGRCSSLVRVDPARAEVRWRTPPLSSNNVFLVHGPYLVAGYGFTAEPDHLLLLDAGSGEILDRLALESAHRYLEIVDGRLVVVTHRQIFTLRAPGS